MELRDLDHVRALGRAVLTFFRKLQNILRPSLIQKKQEWVIPAEAGIQGLSPSQGQEKAKTLDPRLKMSRMTEGEDGHHDLAIRTTVVLSQPPRTLA